MDPLSIIASTITIAGLLRVAIGKAQAIRHGQSHLQALMNEGSTLAIVLIELEKCFLPATAASSLERPHLLKELSICRNRLNDLTERLSHWVEGSSAQGLRTESLAFRGLRAPSKSKAFRDELVVLRAEFSTILLAFNASTSSHTEYDVQKILVACRDTQGIQQEFRREFAGNSRAQVGHLKALKEQFLVLQDEISSKSAHRKSGLQVDQVTTSDAKIEEIRAFPHNGPILFESQQMSAVAAVGIRTAHFRRSACKPWCICRCHKVRQWQTSRHLADVFGWASLGISGWPNLHLGCDTTECRLPSQPVACATYIFPPWLLTRAVSFMLSSTPLAGPVAALKVHRTVPEDSDIFNYARLGDVEKIKSLFEQGLASPHDVSYRCGVTALHVAINYQQIDVCRLLLQANADPFVEDRSHWAPSDGAWTKILFRSYSPEAESQLRDIFTDTDCLERRGFTTIHRIVLGLVGFDLETYLKDATIHEINTTDANGRTAILLAAGRGDSSAVNLLLRHGADINLTSPGEGSPLHVAAIARDSCCLPLLLQHQADIAMTTGYKQTALHYVAAYKNDRERAEVLIEAGADVNARDLDGISPLQWAAVSNNDKVAKALIEHGADLRNTDKYNRTAFVQAVTANRHAVLGVILGAGAAVQDLLGKSGRFLAVMAEHADIETIENLGHIIGPLSSLESEEDLSLPREMMASRGENLLGAFDKIMDAHAPLQKGEILGVPSEVGVEGDGVFLTPSHAIRESSRTRQSPYLIVFHNDHIWVEYGRRFSHGRLLVYAVLTLTVLVTLFYVKLRV